MKKTLALFICCLFIFGATSAMACIPDSDAVPIYEKTKIGGGQRLQSTNCGAACDDVFKAWTTGSDSAFPSEPMSQVWEFYTLSGTVWNLNRSDSAVKDWLGTLGFFRASKTTSFYIHITQVGDTIPLYIHAENDGGDLNTTQVRLSIQSSIPGYSLVDSDVNQYNFFSAPGGVIGYVEALD